MKVSVVIPCYKLDYLAHALISVQKQSVPAHEIFVIYSRATTAAEKINDMVEKCTGDAVIVLSDDDMLAHNFIEETTKAMEESDADIVYTDVQKFGDSKEVMYGAPWSMATFVNTTAPWMTSLIRKKCFDQVGGWDKDQKYQDWDFYFRCFKRGFSGKYIKGGLFLYRVHAGQDTHSQDAKEARQLMKNKHPEINL